MDQIYSSAYLTIVAAAGQDAHMGLPGVSRFHRQRLQDAHIGDIHFVQMPPSGLATIMSSHWASRGWTFQECCLAGRRLIFTEDQTLFLCNKSLVVESVKPHLIRDGWPEFRFGHLLMGTTMHVNTSSLWLEQLQEYSRRNVSYDSDSLNAFLGVLNHWETRLARSEKPMSHLWGLPIRGTTTHGPESVEFCFLWSHNCRDAVRRPDFPSWSWAGWTGTKSFDEAIIHLAGAEQEQCQSGIYISVQSDDLRTQTLADFHKDAVVRTRKSQHYRPGPTRLLVKCPVFPIKIQNLQLSQAEKDAKTELHFSHHTMLAGRPQNDNLILFPISENIKVGISGDLDQHIQPNDRLLGLLLENSNSHAFFLVVKQVGVALHERVSGVYRYRFPWTDMLFLNTEGCILDRVNIPGETVFSGGFERRMTCLV